jgi:hypothetical protein
MTIRRPISYRTVALDRKIDMMYGLIFYGIYDPQNHFDILNNNDTIIKCISLFIVLF